MRRSVSNRPGIRRRAACVLLCAALCALSQWRVAADDKPLTKVACVGDSITWGSRIDDRNMTYPAQLERLLGKGWKVSNFGVSGATLLKHGDKPYVKQKFYDEALASDSDIVVIMLGTNDSKPQNWAHKEDFAADAKALIESFRAADPKSRIYVCLPVPAFAVNYNIHGEIVSGEVIPLLRQVAKEEQTPVIDCFAALTGKNSLFPDNIHPNAEGAGVIAATVCHALTGKD
jgi:acyl-CoA thioesterase-1